MLSGLSFIATLMLLVPGGAGGVQQPKSDKTPIERLPPVPPPIAIRDRTGATIEMVYRWEQLKDEREQFYCGGKCKGGHKSHEECKNKHCDMPCDDKHKHSFKAEVDDYEPGISTIGRKMQELRKSAEECGIENLPAFQISDATWIELNEDTVAQAYDLEVEWPHWSDKPCTTQTRVHKWAVFRLVARATPKKFSPALNALLTGAAVDLDILEMYLPTGKFEDETALPICLCRNWEGVPMPMAMRTGFYPEPRDLRDGQITVTKEGKEFVLGPEVQKEYEVVCSVKSMNEIEWSAINNSSMPIDINIYPGVTLKSADPSYQDVIGTTALKLHLPAMQRGPFSEKVTGIQRAMCLNMHKGQPSGSTGYSVTLSAPEPMVKLAKLYDREPIKTVEGQVRMWIATDQATLPEIQKYLLFPKPTPAQYLHALYAVNKSGRIDLRTALYSKCLDPNLVGGAPSSGLQVRWFVKLMQRVNPKGLAASVKNPANFTDLWTPSAERYQVRYIRDLANVLARSPDPAVALSAADFLLMVPESLRAKVDEEGGLAGVAGWLRRNDASFAETANRVIEAYKSKRSEIALINVNPALPDAVKAKSAELLKAISLGSTSAR